jgi:hypothetical protein
MSPLALTLTLALVRVLLKILKPSFLPLLD